MSRACTWRILRYSTHNILGCLTCRKRKVKCDETKPVCGRCHRLQRPWTWIHELQVIHHGWRQNSTLVDTSTAGQTGLQLPRASGQNFMIELPNVSRATIPYVHHFITFCCRFLVYSNDNEGNPFQEELIPLASSSPALLHSMAALVVGHLLRSQC